MALGRNSLEQTHHTVQRLTNVAAVNLSPLQEFPLVQHTPAARRRPRQAGLLARGFTPAHHLPGFKTQWSLLDGSWMPARRLQLRGQPGNDPVPMTCRSRDTVREKFYFVNAGGLIGTARPATTNVTCSQSAARA
jgi:hypothetical protein